MLSRFAISETGDLTLQQGAKLAGFGLFMMFVAGIFGTAPDAEAVYNSIILDKSQLQKNIVGDIMILVFDVVAALGLFVFLKPVNNSLSRLAAWFRLVHVAIYGAGISFLFTVLAKLNQAGTVVETPGDDLQEQIMLLIYQHEYGFRVGLVFFGFHMLLLGYLIINAKYAPNWLGIFLLLIGVGYLANSFAALLLPNFEEIKNILQQVVYIPAIIGELSLCFWLLLRGSKLTEI